MKKIILIVFTILFFGTFVNAQNVGIGSSSFSPDGSSMLEIRATNQGILIPRIANWASNPASPATGLLIYNLIGDGTNGAGFYYYDGSGWKKLFGGTNNDHIWNQTATEQTAGFRINGNGFIGGNVGIGTTSPLKKLEVNGDIYNRGILFQKTSDGQGSGAHGISWYDPAFFTWYDYMAPVGTTNSPSGTASPADASSGVTTWARRFNIENVAGYGWVFESGPNTSGVAPTAKFAISSNTGTFHATGNGIVDGTVRAGASAILGTNISAGYYQDATNGAYRAIVGSGTTNGYYFQTNGGATTTIYIGLGGSYNGNVGIGTTTPGQKLVVNGGNEDIIASGGGLRLGANNWDDGGPTYGHIITSNSGHNALMIVGNNVAGNSGHGREVKVWDYLNVQGGFSTTGRFYGVGTTDIVSNLNADLLDGQHATAFSPASHTHPWNEITSKPAAWLDAANLIQDDANFNNSVPSGFYQYNNAANAPTAGTWYNMINVRHSNTSNDHGFQIAASYYDENIWTRTYQGGTGANNGTFTPWRKLLHTGNIATLYPNINGDNLGNHTATTTLNMNWNHINNVADIYCINNYGQGLVGVYSDVRYQNVWAMGTSWRLAADGTTPGNLYGIAWTHSNIGGQSRPSLSHQMLVMENGVTKVALGSGIWTNYGIETGANGTYNRFNTWTELPNATGFYSGINGAHFYPNDASYGSWRILGTRNGWAGIEFPSGAGNISLMIGQGGWGGMTTGMHANNYGWLWRFEHQRLWADGLTDVNDPNYYSDPNGSSRLAYLYHGVGAYSIGGWLSGIMQTETTSDGHQYLPLTGNWGYIGTSSQYWYYSYAMSHVNISQRSLKRDIAPLNKPLYELVMNDIDRLKPSLYKFKDETDELESGNEAKYRPNMHLGVVLDESPDYIQDQAFSGIDIYALATLAIAGVKYNREDIKEIKENIGLSEKKMTVSDFGNEEMKENETWISFTDEFIIKLSGTSPIITVTPNQTGVWLSVTETTSKGFKVVASGNSSSVTFNWIAMAKVNIEQKEDKTQQISQDLINQLIVDESKKAMIREYWKKQTEKNQAEHKQQVEEQKKIAANNKEKITTVPVFPKKENEKDMNLPANQKPNMNEPAEIPKAQEINQQKLKK